MPSKPKSPQESPPSPPVSTITALVRATVDTTPDMATLDYSQYRAEWELSGYAEKDLIKTLCALVSTSVEVLRNFAERVPGFNELPKADQELLLHSTYLELFSLRLAYQ